MVLTALVTHEERTENVPHSWECLFAGISLAPAVSPSPWVRLVSVGFPTLPLLMLWLCVPPLPSEEPWVVPDVRPPTLSCTFRGVLGLSLLCSYLEAWCQGTGETRSGFLEEACQEQLFSSQLLIWPSLAVTEGREGKRNIQEVKFMEQALTRSHGPPESPPSPTQCPWWLEALG